MATISMILIIIVICLHLYFMWMEMFAWTTIGKRTFKIMPPEMFETTKTMAANQGLYNGFLAAGLIWGLCIADSGWSQNVFIYFLSCVLLAGIYGWYSVSIRIFYIQGIPALLGLLSLVLSR